MPAMTQHSGTPLPPAWQALDSAHVWHPYSAMGADTPVYPVLSAHGVRIRLADGRELIDGMASWWCAIHGYNQPELNTAVTTQLADMAHVMFGGLTHRPAAELAALLVELTAPSLQAGFFADVSSHGRRARLKIVSTPLR